MVPVSCSQTYLFRNGEVVDYKGAVDIKMYNWIMRQLFPGIRHMVCHDLKLKVELYKTNAIYFGKKEGALYEEFELASNLKSGYLFFTADEACGNSFGGSEGNRIAVHTTFANTTFFEGEPTTEVLAKFLETSSVPDVVNFSEFEIDKIFGKNQTICMIFTNQVGEIATEHYNMFAEVAKKHKG